MSGFVEEGEGSRSMFNSALMLAPSYQVAKVVGRSPSYVRRRYTTWGLFPEDSTPLVKGELTKKPETAGFSSLGMRIGVENPAKIARDAVSKAGRYGLSTVPK